MEGRFWIINGEAVFVREDGRVYDGFEITLEKRVKVRSVVGKIPTLLPQDEREGG